MGRDFIVEFRDGRPDYVIGCNPNTGKSRSLWDSDNGDAPTGLARLAINAAEDMRVRLGYEPRHSEHGIEI